MAVCLVLQQARTSLFWLLKNLSQHWDLFTLSIKCIFYQSLRHSSLFNFVLIRTIDLPAHPISWLLAIIFQAIWTKTVPVCNVSSISTLYSNLKAIFIGTSSFPAILQFGEEPLFTLQHRVSMSFHSQKEISQMLPGIPHDHQRTLNNNVKHIFLILHIPHILAYSVRFSSHHRRQHGL